MTFGDFLTQTRKKWFRAFRILKKSDKSKKKMASSPSRSSNRISPDSFLGSSYSGTVDASEEIQIEKFCKCGTQSDPPFPNLDDSRPLSTYENASFNYDSAYDTDQSSPKSCRTSESSSFTVHHATVSYYHVKDKEDTSSISTELTWLEYDLEESENLQNVVNEKIELMTSL